MTTEVNFPVPAHFKMTCGPFSSESAAVGSTPDDHAKIEAAMMVALMTHNADGRLLGFRLPPAVAQAIVHVMSQPCPLQAALDFTQRHSR